MFLLPAQAIRGTQLQESFASSKISKISDQKNILEKFLKISENWLRFLEIAKKLPEVLSEENLQV